MNEHCLLVLFVRLLHNVTLRKTVTLTRTNLWIILHRESSRQNQRAPVGYTAPLYWSDFLRSYRFPGETLDYKNEKNNLGSDFTALRGIDDTVKYSQKMVWNDNTEQSMIFFKKSTSMLKPHTHTVTSQMRNWIQRVWEKSAKSLRWGLVSA